MRVGRIRGFFEERARTTIKMMMTMDSMIERHCVGDDRDAVAIYEYSGESGKVSSSWTYRKLWVESGKIARSGLFVRERKGGIVGVCVSEGVGLHLVQVACLRANKIFVPISVETESSERLRFLANACEFETIIVTNEAQKAILVNKLSHQKQYQNIVSLDDLLNMNVDDDHHSHETKGSERRNLTSHIFFTSGSTGIPKGCVVSEQALVSYCLSRNKKFKISKSSRVFIASSATFYPSYGDALATLIAGASLHIGKTKSDTFQHLGKLLAKSRADFCSLTPSAAHTMLSDDDLNGIKNPILILLGGERASTQVLEKLLKYVRVGNIYGVTECCVYQTFAEILDSKDAKKIGEPYEGLSIVLAKEPFDDPEIVLNKDLDRGVVGEIYISGAQVGDGYFKAEELTKERFIVSQNSKHRFFRTGDFGKYDEDSGAILLLGRKDNQVKINGVRIELEEVENLCLKACGDFMTHIAAACIVSKNELALFCCRCCATEEQASPLPTSSAYAANNSNNKLLEKVKAALEDAVRFCVGKLLPTSMRPKQIYILNETSLPMSMNGKVDRRKLLSDDYLASLIAEKLTFNREDYLDDDEDERSVALETALDFAIAQSWNFALGGGEDDEQFRLNSNFLFAGGDSLAALIAVKKLKETLGQIQGEGSFGEDFGALQPNELMNRPTLRTYAQYLALKLDNSIPKNWTERSLGRENNKVVDENVIFEYEKSLIRTLCFHNQHKALRSVLTSLNNNNNNNNNDNLLSLFEDDMSACIASENGHFQCLEVLLEHKVTFLNTCRGARKATILHYACRNAHQSSALETLRILSEFSSSSSLVSNLMQFRDEDGQTPLHVAARNGASRSILEQILLLSKKKEKNSSTSIINDVDKFKRTPLHWACVNGHKNTVVSLLEFGADLTKTDEVGETALLICERRALCASTERANGDRPSVFADIATVLGGSGSTKNLTKKGIK